MFIIKNAWTSIVRNKGRNILIGIIILVISCAVSIMLAINNTSNKLIKSYQSGYDIQATIGINRENMMKDFNPEDMDESKESMKEMFEGASNLSISDIDNYGDSKYVKNYYYTITTSVNSNTLEKVSSSMDSDNKGFSGGPQDGPNEQDGDFTLKGYSSLSSMTDFIEGSYKITDGEVFEDFTGNNCLVNSEFATLNNLSVGATITLLDSNNEANSYELVISGIYEEEDSDDNKMNMFSNSANTIITSSSYVKKMNEVNSDLKITITPTFVLTSKKVIDKFSDELSEKGLNENLVVETNLEQVENSTSTISNVKTFSITFLIITLIIGAIILLVINMINIRERKYEIGVLRTIGMKKKYVSLQFIIELFIVSIFSLMLGAGIGATMSVKVSNSLLENEISASQSEMSNIKDNFGKPSDDKGSFTPGNIGSTIAVEKFDSIDATIDLKVLLELLGIGLLLTLISSISAISSIQRFSPLAILKERS